MSPWRSRKARLLPKEQVARSSRAGDTGAHAVDGNSPANNLACTHAMSTVGPWPGVDLRRQSDRIMVKQVAAIQRVRLQIRDLRLAANRRKVKGKWSREACYPVTPLTITHAAPGQLAAIIRGHWGIEDRLHWVRDTDFDEDHSQIRTAAGPQIMASLRNLAITILRLAGAASIAAAMRYHARRPARPPRTIMKC
jgi:predicted transposase YbfD/YdcC